jgi:hypothetical protein
LSSDSDMQFVFLKSEIRNPKSEITFTP